MNQPTWESSRGDSVQRIKLVKNVRTINFVTTKRFVFVTPNVKAIAVSKDLGRTTRRRIAIKQIMGRITIKRIMGTTGTVGKQSPQPYQVRISFSF